MVTIESVSARGFKSFAKKTELLFGKKYNVVIGPNGSGKSLSYDSFVTISNGSEIKIGELIEKKLSSAKAINKLKDGVYCDGDGTSVLSINPLTMKVEERRVEKFVKRTGEKLYKIKTRTGKKVKATGCHPVMVFKEGTLKSVLIRDIKEKEVIATPRKITINPQTSFEEEKARLIGYLLGDGSIGREQIRFINQEEELIADINDLVYKHFKERSKKNQYKPNKKLIDLVWYNKSLINWLNILFKGKKLNAGNKEIPNEILTAPLGVNANLLAGLFDTDGSIRKNPGIIEFCSKNEHLTHQVQRLLLRFNIVAKVKKRMQHANNTEAKTKRSYSYLYIYGYENLKRFYINIPLKCNHKKRALEIIVKERKTSNPNVDVLPRETNILIRKAVELLGVKVKPLKKHYPRLSAYMENRCCPTRQGLQEIFPLLEEKIFAIHSASYELKKNPHQLVEVMDLLNLSGRETGTSLGLSKQIIRDYWATGVFAPRTKNLEAFFKFISQAIRARKEELQKVMNTLEYLTDSDIFWDEIISIEQVEEEEYVYDLTIPNNHNFIAEGIFMHNSNIIDLITFVLGKSSSKQLRAEKSAGLIYNGGKQNPPAKFAEASIVFDNSSKEFPLPEEKVTLTRIVKGSGNSTYRINGQRMTRQQVLDTLSKARINYDGHNIVLQGDIVQLMEMHPEERRFVIEEVSGISVYEEKKQKAMQELQKVDSKLHEASIILTERSTYLRELKSERDLAVKYRELETTIKRSKATLIDKQLREREAKLREILAEIEKQEKQKTALLAAIHQFKESINHNKEDTRTINEYLDKRGKKDQLDLQKEIEQLKDSQLKSSTRLDAIQTELARIEQRRKQLSQDAGDIEKKIAGLRKELEDAHQKEQALKQQDASVAASIQEFRKKQNLDSLEELEQTMERKQSNLTNLQEKKLNLAREYDRQQYQLQDVESKLNIQPAGKPSQLPDMKKEFSSITAALNKKLDENAAFAIQLGKARRSLVENNENLARVRMLNMSAAEHSAADLAISRILKSGITGIYNTVASLGEANKKYSLALEVAAGSRINSIVVEDDATAARCIQHLKQNKLGIAAFLPLNKMRPATIQKFTGAGIHGPALDLVKFQPKFRDVFAYVFGSTLIVDNVDTARRMGIGKVRMVTLEGDLMESSGAMIGGHRTRSRGIAFKEKESAEEAEKLEAEVARLQEALNTIENNREQNESSIQQLREKKANLEVDILKLEKLSGSQDYEILKKKHAELKAAFADTSKKMQDVDEDLTSIQKELAALHEKKQKSGILGNKEFAALEASREKLRESLASSTTSIRSIKAQLDTILLPEQSRMKSILSSHEKEKQQFSQELQQLEEKLTLNKQALKDKEAQQKQFYAEFRQQFDKRTKLQNDLQKIETSLIREEEHIRNVEAKTNTFQIERARLTAEAEGLKKEFEPFLNIELRRGIELADLKYEIQKSEKEIEKLGSINLKALEVYEKLEQEFSQLKEKESKLLQEKQDVLGMMQEVETKKKDLFMKTFKEIDTNFTRIFQNLSTKGDAYLELQDRENPFNGGVTIKVKITGSKFLDIKSLSGGEKTMAALALIFSIQEHQPASFYVMDEVDAALDKTNSALLSKLIQKYAEKAQYIVVSHNDTVISEADQIYGVSMQQGISKVVSLKI